MTRPWETVVGSQPWEAQQTPFPRTIRITRPNSTSASGLVGYSGDVEANETTIASSVPANVAIASAGRNSASGGLPGDSPGPIKWSIMIPPVAVPALPLIVERDVVYDDLGRRFQVSAFEPTAVGARIDCVRVLA